MLFQPSVLKKHLADLDAAKVRAAYDRFRTHFADPAKQENIRSAKEEQYQEGFLRDLFVDVLGYTLNPSPGYDLSTEFKNLTDAKKADGAVLLDGKAIAVIELKGTNTTDFKKIEEQAFRYKNNQRGCRYVVTSNFERLRFYVDDATEFEQFDLFSLDYEAFARLWLCLAKVNLMAGLPADIKARSIMQEEQVTRKLYADYSQFKHTLFGDLCTRNTRHDRLLLFQKAQKLLDRLLFIFFAEDRGLLPPNSIHQILTDWQKLRDLDEPVSLYTRFRKFFGYLHSGHSSPQLDIFGYNGGLFAPDPVLDELEVDDTVLFNGTWAITRYDFETEVDVDILGHIFEHSLNEIEEVQAEIEGRPLDRAKTKRKKDGVFYTPKYITRYIVDNTAGALCRQKQAELALRDEDYADRADAKKKRKELSDRLNAYQTWLEGITILDPACGSGAFLNAAFTFLVAEHERVDRLRAVLFGDSLLLRDVELSILENNLFGVDLNDESVEIAQLALWLRTARKGRKLSTLSQNIRVGNSLVSDPAVAGDKAFDWAVAFPQVFAQGGFDVVVGNPPYGASLDSTTKLAFNELYQSFQKNNDIYTCFLEKVNSLINLHGVCGYIIPVSWQTADNYLSTRRFFLKNYALKIGIKLPYDVFADAYVDTGIYVFGKRKEGDFEADVYEYPVRFELRDLESTIAFKKLPSSKWEAHPQLNLVLNPDFYGLDFSKNTVPLEVLSESIRGILPGNEDVQKERDERFSKPYFVGDVYRYEIHEAFEFVHYGSHLKEKPNRYNWFEGERILVRRLINRQFRLMATFVDTEFVNKKDLYVLKITDKRFSPKFILGLINSKLVSYFKTKGSTTATKDDFSQLTLSDIRGLPIPLCSAVQQIAVVERVEEILSTQKSLSALAARFLRLLTSKHPGLQATKKLEAWPSLSFADFLKEVKKQKVAWSLREEAEWMGYFEEEQRAARALQGDAARLDAEIDRLVYALYGLTEEEVGVVERG